MLLFHNFISRYNMTTGKYPYEGGNIYRLYENIGKGEYSIPEEVDSLLRSLLTGLEFTTDLWVFTVQDSGEGN